MKNLNKFIGIGRITKDVDERSFSYLSTGTAKLTTSIAINDSKKDQMGNWVDEVSYFDVVIWGKTAENLKQYLNKGVQIAVEGRLKQDRWQDQNGQNRSKIYINAENVELLARPQNNSAPQNNYQGGGNYNQNYNQNYNNAPQNRPAPAPQQAENGWNGNMNNGFEDYPPEWDNVN